MKKSAALFFLCLTFARCVFADTAITNDNLIVAFQMLDRQWIEDCQAHTGEYARIYKDALQTTKPPQYGTYLLDQNGNLVYTSVSQRELWDFLSSNASYFNDEVQNDGDGLGDYIKVSWLATLFGAFSYNSSTGLCETRPLDHALTTTARRLSTLSVSQSDQEIEAVSNATCNCDWTIVTNIYTTLLGFANGTTNVLERLNNRQDDIYKWLTGVDNIGNGYPFSFPEWLDNAQTNLFSIFRMLYWDNSSIKDFYNDFNLSDLAANVSFNDPEINSYINSDDYLYFLTLGSTADSWAFGAEIYNKFLDVNLSQSIGSYYGALSYYYNMMQYIKEGLRWQKITQVQTNQSNIAIGLFTGDIQDKFSYLTNLYATDGPYDMPYTERLELLLAALVFAEDAQADTNQTSFSDAETNAEDIKTQYISLVNQLNQTILGDVKSNIERTDRTLLSFFQSLNSALDFQYQPNIHIEHNVDSNFGTDSLPNGFGIGDYWEFDLESSGVDTFIKFCRACTSIMILSGWLFIVWQLGRGTAKICWRMAVLAFKTASKLLG